MHHVCTVLTVLLFAKETSNQLCHDTDQMGECQNLTLRGPIDCSTAQERLNQPPLNIDFNICQFIPADLSPFKARVQLSQVIYLLGLLRQREELWNTLKAFLHTLVFESVGLLYSHVQKWHNNVDKPVF